MSNSTKQRKRKGLRCVIHETIYKLAKRVMTLDVTHLMRLDNESVREPESAPNGFTFRFLTSDEVRTIAANDNELTSALADRIDKGSNFCFGALVENQLAAYAWYAVDFIEAENNRGDSPNSGVAIALPENMAFMYKGFTHPRYRGQGLYGHVNARALELLEAYGVSTVISTADWTNWSALRSCWRVGYQDLGLVWRAGWGNMMVTIPPRNGKALGLKFSEDARKQSELECAAMSSRA